MRLDLFVAKTFSTSRTEASRMIKDGKILVNEKICLRPSWEVTDHDTVVLTEAVLPYVSRGGLKLEGALSHFGISPEGAVALDVGASTGGFTHCLLLRGASHVYAVENGYGQLAIQLLEDPRVTSMEHYNARDLAKCDFPLPITFATMDVSFISQKLILPALFHVLETGAKVVSLIKPQFEVGPGCVGKGGIVRHQKDRERAVQEVVAFAESIGFISHGTVVSPIQGGDGNIEYLAYFEK